MFKYLILLSSLLIAIIAAFFSVTGLARLFAGSFIPVVIMASVLEMGKLVSASFLTRHWKNLNFTLKFYYILATTVLILITSAGIYGFLTAAYQTTADEFNIINRQTSVLELRKDRYEEQLNLYITERQTLSVTIDRLSSGLANNIVQYVDSATGQLVTSTSGANRNAIQQQLNNATEQRSTLANQIEEMTDSITSLDIQIIDLTSNSDVTREIGPLRYISNLTGWPMDQVVNLYALLIIFVFDPLAVALIIGFNRIQLQEKNEKNKKTPKINSIEKIENVKIKKIEEDIDNTQDEVLDLIEEKNVVEKQTTFEPPIRPIPSDNFLIKENEKIDIDEPSIKKSSGLARDIDPR